MGSVRFVELISTIDLHLSEGGVTWSRTIRHQIVLFNACDLNHSYEE